jgi:hypothetical protein
LAFIEKSESHYPLLGLKIEAVICGKKKEEWREKEAIVG